MRHLYVTHPEVVVDAAVPIQHWPLSPYGRQRTAAFAASGVASGFDLIVSSTETKARDTAEILADALSLPVEHHPELAENDRSATGFLPPDEFERTADLFFGHPDTSVRGWEAARTAQARVVVAVRGAVTRHPGRRLILVGHGGVGSLLRCDLLDLPIGRQHDQPRQGCWYTFDSESWRAESGWRALPDD
ncbi:phosphoglycerate mutase family protein [Nocardioides carbamazepini]|uniref:histidine phosphatase family protein n=1 Tax=Nocardioides carbamazepini TaxID=2854259 RepID=UPI002149A2A9|nr:histidine phosphatase family protein [Nocardioides carbamazepini]MCR1780945.1 phosphoglycerate mutase family protein [Nocardioides carbamazepini]